ncbi:hypothetical protein I7I51_06225 [Histoplasma capsulatum]|uniref:Utp8 beta-propeller domain-containing protein n=1 Tax=Ajellomyces capsulatus TaxID=5037 RepID=A0A8A1ML48_AJECA|nr:hypothetical protein I7I51_06225 [Histoplasma capsulatum]
MELQAPFVLAQLPRALGASAGKCQLGEVHGVAGPKKRKRHEVVAAIDGESVNIYNVQFPKLVTSYAIPPQSSFSCPPCSVRQKSTRNSNTVTRRQTYCAIEQPENQVQCFLDESTASAHNALNISNTSFKLKDSQSPIVFLGIIPASLEAENQQDPFDVLVVHKDGRVRRLSPDLKTQKWNALPTTGIERSTTHEIQTAFLVAFDDARKSLFKKRQDIVAMVMGDEIGTESGKSSMLILVSRPLHKENLLPSDFDVNIFSLPARAAEDDFSTNHAKRLRHLMAIRLPNSEEQQTPFDPKSLHWSFHPNNSGLSLSFNNGFINYNISPYSPEISSHLILPNETFSSIMRISPQSVICASRSSIAIYNARYQTIQADLSLMDISTAIAAKSDTDRVPIVFVSYFSKLGIAIAIRGSALLGFDLSSSHDRDASLKQSGDELLINALGKGIRLPSDSIRQMDAKRVNHMRLLGLSEPDEAARWAEFKKQLEALAEAKDTVKFDNVIKDAFCRAPVSGEDDKPKHLPSSANFVDPDKVSFLLGKIFSSRVNDVDPKTSKLVVSFMPHQTFRWLINSHNLSLNSIRTALRQSMNSKQMPPIPSGSLVQALVDYERSIKLLLQVLQNPINLDPPELAHALKILLDFARFHQPRSEEELPTIITEAGRPSKENSPHITTPENQSKPTTTTPEIDTTITDVITGLNLSLTKLNGHPIHKVTQAIRSVLSNSDTVSIIHHLRHSLATGGYTSRFMEQSEGPLSSDPKIPTLNLSTMVNVLTACIDAIGPSGWISAAAFAGAEDSEASLIADMKSEISAVLVGIEEATYLKGIVREFVRYAETATVGAGSGNRNNKENQADRTSPTLPRGSRLKRKERHNGAEILIYDTDNVTVAEGLLNSDTQMLPLSLKRVQVAGGAGIAGTSTTMVGEEVSRTKIRKMTGEVVARTEREIGYLRRKAVGKYSFERIVV